MELKNARPEISALRAFLWTARTGSTAGAAKVIKVSQPAVSTAIHKLEKIFEVPLFNRSSRPMQLTPAGRILRSRVEPILEELDNLPTEIQGTIKHSAVDLRIGFSDSFGGVIVPYLLPKLLPSVGNLAAYTSTTFKVFDKLINGGIDVAIATKFPSENPKIIGMLAFYEHFLVATPKSYKGTVDSLRDVMRLAKELPVIRFNDDSLDAVQIERVLRQCNTHRGRSIMSDTNQTVLSLVANHIGWTIIPPLGALMGKDFLPGVNLHRIENIQATRTFYVMYEHPVFGDLATQIVKEVQAFFRDMQLPTVGEIPPIVRSSIVMTPLE